MSAHGRHLVRALAIALGIAAVALLAAVMDASAYVTASGGGSAAGSVTTLAAPTIARTSTGGGSVTLTWSTVSAPASGAVTYYVSRDGGAASAACPSSASPTSATSCTDTGVSAGAHQYTVTAVWRSWTRTSATANVTVAFGAATQLVFTTQPGGSATGGTAFPTQPVVTARDASGNTVTDYSGTVSLSILRGGAGGATLSGCTGTLRNGVTTFAGCKIDKSGSAYYLHASDGTLGGDSSSFDVSVGTAAQLLFTTQPGGSPTGGTAFPTQPVVVAADAGGNTVTSFSSTITLSIGSGRGTLQGCFPSRRNGVTTFSGCEIEEAGTGYTLHASASLGALTGDSASFDVTVGPLSQLVFTTQPGGGATDNVAFPTQPVVAATDAGGNVVTSYSRTITLSITKHSGPGNAKLSGCRGALSNGVTTFSGCQLDQLGSNYQLTASDSTRSIDSNAFAVTAGPATQISFTTSPSGATGGTAFTTQPVVTALDAGGNVATSYAGTVTLTVGSGTGTLSGCSASLRSGVTTFSGCKLDRAGSYRLHASDGTFSDDSSSFTVTFGSAAQLLFTTQPVGARAGNVFATQPAITAYDAGGNVVTNYSTTITLSIKSGTGATGASLSGCTQVHSSGVTTFSGCKIDKSGSGYVLHAAASALTVDSNPFNIS